MIVSKNIPILFIAFLLTVQFVFGQQPVSDNNKIYAALIKSQIAKTAKSVTIINKLQNDKESSHWVPEAIISKDTLQLNNLRFLCRDSKGNSVRSFDTTLLNDILRFYQTQPKDSTFHFQLRINVEVFTIDNFPFTENSRGEWDEFYKKYPGSGGLFQFSNIYYSADGKTAIFYYSVLRHGLNGHGALTIMTKIKSKWKIKYHITFWQA